MLEIDKLLHELRNMKNEQKTVLNTKEVWKAIGNRDWETAGFANEEEALAWLEQNNYSNIG